MSSRFTTGNDGIPKCSVAYLKDCSAKKILEHLEQSELGILAVTKHRGTAFYVMSPNTLRVLEIVEILQSDKKFMIAQPCGKCGHDPREKNSG